MHLILSLSLTVTLDKLFNLSVPVFCKMSLIEKIVLLILTGLL